MKPSSLSRFIQGPAGRLQVAVDEPQNVQDPIGVVVICHPHPLYGGTMENKVIQSISRACTRKGWRCVRFNYRGVEQSEGTWDAGCGETEDAIAVIQALHLPDKPLAIAGFSFGGFVAANLLQQYPNSVPNHKPIEHVLLVSPAVINFPVPTVPKHTLVIHGETDDVVPLSGTIDWARPQHLPVLVVPGVGHFFHGQLTSLQYIITRFWI